MSAHADTAREPVPAPTRLVTHLLRPEARRDAVVAVVAATLLALWDLSGADLQVVRWFGHGDGFAWRDAWLTSTVLHEGGRLIAWGLFAGLVLNVWRPLIAGPSASERIRALVATTISLLSVSALKRVSHTSCPWDLAEFGGTARYVSHWSFGVLDGGAGHCFPSGHAVGAFAFVSGYFMLRGHRPALARAWLAAVLCTGAAFGMAQLARGAHYPSHTFWSAWLCWVVCAAFTAASHRAHGPVTERREHRASLSPERTDARPAPADIPDRRPRRATEVTSTARQY